MLSPEIIKTIEDYVSKGPRTIQEIAILIKKNWRTADRYVEDITKNFGTVSTKVFRGGTRGALKIVYWSSVDKVSHNVFQEMLEKEILHARRKEDFSAFDIFQHVQDTNKKAIIERAISEDSVNINELKELLLLTEKQLLIFSGNLSFINLHGKNFSMLEIIDRLVKKGVNIKIICRVDIAGKDNIERVLGLNYKHSCNNIEIHHREHPIRAFVVDNKVFRIKEIKEPTGKCNELDTKVFIFYTIKDKEWTEWMSKIFWKMFSNSVDSVKRIEELKKLKNFSS